uniref:MFS domain-containing protein n=1 Tax=Panagrellus redivivus TaxID=6233 RepID=A0A7E4VZI3_PANRE
MKVAIILSLLSALQIHHQTIINAFSSAGFAGGQPLDGFTFSFVAGAFPAGKIFGTAIVNGLCRKYSLLAGLDLNAICLLFGTILSLVPLTFFLALGRFIIGIGVGCGFVLASVVTTEFYSFDKRPSAFFIGAIFFGGAALYSNFCVDLVANSGYFWAVVVINAPSVVAGLAYFRDRQLFIDRLCFPLEPLTIAEKDLLKADRGIFAPMTVTYVLMALNATIGVPIIMAFSTIIFTACGISPAQSARLSVFYPLVQLTQLGAFRLPSTMPSRRSLILGGYMAALSLQFCFLMSIQGIETNSISPKIAATLFLLFAVITSIPCNTAFCFVTEQFPDRETQIAALAKGRLLLWFLSTVETTTFKHMLQDWSLFVALLPYFVASVALLVLLVFSMGAYSNGNFKNNDEDDVVEAYKRYDAVNFESSV